MSRALLLIVLLTCFAAPLSAQTITYTVTFPAPEHHWLQIDATFPELGAVPLRAFMSRSSPGRYAVHEFAKNVFWLEAHDGQGRVLRTTRPNPYEWDVAGHDGIVKLTYRVFGDLVDGTYLAVDRTHAHMNMPATFMFDLDRQDRPIRVTFTRPAGLDWRVGTQLYPTSDPFSFSAPNLQYFMDSPTEFSSFLSSTFSVADARGRDASFRVVAHTTATQEDVDELAKLVQRLVREQLALFGEFPEYEPGTYTFLLDYRSGNDGDGMEHRNSTVITQSGESLLKTPEGRRAALSTISHEFFHNWNVERIRPAGIEPFDFTRANVTCCLWLAEGFTEYYGPLLLTRAGLRGGSLPANPIPVINGSGRQVRSAVEMSEFAPFSDAAVSVDPTDQGRSFISYYTYGAAIALALDLSLRDRSRGATSLDDFMRALWQRFGSVRPAQPGLVRRPYSLGDLRDVLAAVSGDRTFASDFFDRFVEGREVVDYARLLDRAGYSLRVTNPNAAWTGASVQQGAQGLVVGGSRGALVPFGTPAYDAGLEQGDVIARIDGQPATVVTWDGLRQRRPGDRVALDVIHRGGVARTTALVLKADPSLTISDLGAAMTEPQRAFREAWLGSKVTR